MTRSPIRSLTRRVQLSGAAALGATSLPGFGKAKSPVAYSHAACASKLARVISRACKSRCSAPRAVVRHNVL